MSSYLRIIALVSALIALATVGACDGQQTNDTESAGAAGTPTEAYKQLYTAVKAKDSEGIKKVLSKDTIAFAQGIANQTKKTFEKQIENGFTRTTFSDEMPAIRDERIKENMGAIEVYNAKDSIWEDLPFILEDGGWKLAVGNIFNGSWKRPGESRSVRERRNANMASNNNGMIPYGNGNIDFNSVEVVPMVPAPAANINQANPAANSQKK